jgi:exosortase
MTTTIPSTPLKSDQAAPVSGHRGVAGQVAGLGLLGLCFAWSYWPTLKGMAERWSSDSQYSHGFLVPVFAAVILWHRRDLRPRKLMPSWWGLAVLMLALGTRLASAYWYFDPLDSFSVVPAVAGLCLLLGGWGALQWAWPAIAFLGFMLPLPFHVEVALAQPLRRLATVASTYCLQTLGYPAFSEGNIILIDDVRMGVADACNGLGMLMTFFALATAVAIVSQRPLVDKLVIVVSAVPIAVMVNVVRITATGVFHCELGAAAGQWLHDWAGWVMMPLALGILWAELQLLKRLLVEVEAAGPLPVSFARSGPQAQAAPPVIPAPRAETPRAPTLSRAFQPDR